MSNAVSNKINHIFTLLSKLSNHEELYPQNKALQDELGVSERTLRRYLEDIYTLYSHIIIIEKSKINNYSRNIVVYRMLKENDFSRILKYFLNYETDISWIMQLIIENDPSILNNLNQEEQNKIKNAIDENNDCIEFITKPFEILNINDDKNFSNLKEAVKKNEYRKIEYKYNELETFDEAKCLKILFITNNWYLAIETENQFRLIRISFIKSISYSKRNSYQKSIMKKYEPYFETIQNAFTLYGSKKEKAILEISYEKAKYFLPNMKKFYSSQKFIEKLDNNNILISIEYTQSLEILPFIKEWIPHIKIIEPLSLKNKLKQDMDLYLKSFD